MPQFAIVILNWNGKKLLEQFLPSIIKYTADATIYVADNASTDDSIDLIKTHFPTIRIIINDNNYGYAEGYNRALTQLTEPYLALVNSDIEVTPNWLKPIGELFDKQQEIAIIQPKILDFKDPSKFEYAGAGGGYIDRFGFPFCRGRIFDTIEADLGQYNDNRSIFWASGACFFIRNTVFQELNGFDVDFFAHQEEIDLCWRAKNRGYQVYYCGQSTVYHVGGATLNYLNPRKTYLNFRNSLYMLLKNLPRKNLFLMIFMRLCMDGMAGIKFLLNGNPKHCMAVIQSHFDFYKKASLFYGKRDKHQQVDYFYCQSIAKQYFLQKRRYFKQIL